MAFEPSDYRFQFPDRPNQICILLFLRVCPTTLQKLLEIREALPGL